MDGFQKNLPKKQEGKKTVMHAVGWLFLAMILTGTVGFFGLIGYYAWQIKFGDAVALERQFSEEFTAIPGVSRTTAQQTISPQVLASVIRTANPTLGKPDAPVTVIAFIDFECPFSQKSYTTFTNAIQRFEPVVRVVFKHFPLEAIHPNSRRAALGASCAHAQGKFWDYYHTLFTQKRFDAESLTAYAKTVGLNEKQFSECLDTEQMRNIVDEDLIDGSMLDVRGTPTFLVNGEKIEGSVSIDVWNDVLLRQLQKTKE